MNKEKYVGIAVNLRLRKDLYEGVEECAKKEHFSSVPEFIRQTLRDRLKEESA